MFCGLALIRRLYLDSYRLLLVEITDDLGKDGHRLLHGRELKSESEVRSRSATMCRETYLSAAETDPEVTSTGVEGLCCREEPARSHQDASLGDVLPQLHLKRLFLLVIVERADRTEVHLEL